MRMLFFFFLLFTKCFAHFPQNINGKVIDGKTGLPLEGATVTLLPSNIITVSDERGQFIFNKNIIAGSFIQISCIGFETKIFEISYPGAQWLSMLMPVLSDSCHAGKRCHIPLQYNEQGSAA